MGASPVAQRYRICLQCRRCRSIPRPGGHGNPLQYSCWGNPMDRGAWQATVHAVSKSWTRLKQLSTSTHDVFLYIYIYIYIYIVSIPGSKVCITALKFVILDCYYLYYDIDILDLQNLLTGFKFVLLNISPDLQSLVTTILLCMSSRFLDSLHK